MFSKTKNFRDDRVKITHNLNEATKIKFNENLNFDKLKEMTRAIDDHIINEDKLKKF